MALAKKNRLNLRLHRLRVETNSKKLHSPFFTYIIAPQSEHSSLRHSALDAESMQISSRFAILISKKLLKKAVHRNQLKRKISQAIQDLPHHSYLSRILSKNLDIILIPKRDILNKTVSQIQADLLKLLTSNVIPTESSSGGIPVAGKSSFERDLSIPLSLQSR